MQDNRSRQDILLDAIGDIEDRFIFEAMSPAPARHRAPLMRRFAIVGISFALALTVGMASLIVSLSQRKDAAEAPEDGTEQTLPPPGDVTESVTLNEALTILRDTTEHCTVEKEDIDLFGKKTLIVWKYSNEELYRYVALDSSDAYDLCSLLRSRNGFTEIGSQSSDSDVEGIWICAGNGEVVSPQLKAGNGNVSLGQFFSYAAEVEPSAEFTELLVELINGSHN